MRFAIHAPAGNTRGPQYVEPLIDAVHQAGSRQSPLRLEIASSGEQIVLIADVPPELKSAFVAAMQDSNAGYSVTPVDEPTTEASATDVREWSLSLRLAPDACLLRTWQEFEDRVQHERADPLSGILSALRTGRSGRFETRIQLTIRAIGEWRKDGVRRTLRRLNRRFLFHRLETWHRDTCTSPNWLKWTFAAALRLLSVPADDASRADAEKADRHLFECTLLLSVRAPADDGHTRRVDRVSRSVFDADRRVRRSQREQPPAAQLAKQKLRELAGAIGCFTSEQVKFLSSRIRRGTRPRFSDRFALCAAEIATLWHPPTEATDSVARLQRTTCPELEPPVWLPSPHRDPDVTELGRVQYRRHRDRCGIKLDDRRRHLFICGKTGMGKSTLMLNMLTSDIRAGRGVCLIDPHGDLADAVRTVVPKRRRNDVILFDAGDRTSPIAWNPLACRTEEQRPLVAEGVLAAMKKVFAESWGPRMEDILRHGLLALLETPGTTLLSLQRLLVEPNFRRSIVGRVADPVVRAYWEQTFAGWNDRFRSEAISPVQNKLGQFLANPLTRNIIDAPKSRIDLRRIMDRGQILIVNLSQGRIGEPASNLLGAFLVSSLHLSAMSRADTPEPDRRDFMCYVDEFQNFATESFASILSQARKYRLSLTMACQYLDQMGEATQHAVFGNVGSLLCFQVGVRDAELLAPEFGERVTANDLSRMPKYFACVRPMIDGASASTFTMTTLSPSAGHPKNN